MWRRLSKCVKHDGYDLVDAELKVETPKPKPIVAGGTGTPVTK